jgi:ectoine hydroxylase-related dioxygenase (phytanoyl-CoA dioxygenase family)
MTVAEALTALGVREDSLTESERQHLDDKGYLPLFNVLSPEQVISMRKTFDDLVALEGDRAGLEVHQEEGTQRLADLINKDPIFDVCISHPRVLAAVSHVLKGNLHFSSLNGRASLPGQGLQALHCDYGEAAQGEDYRVCNSIWLLTDFTEENGATRVVPGTHRSGAQPQDVLDDPKAAHPDEVQLCAPAGTVVVFNSHLWHGGTVNHSNQPRHALHSFFSRREISQQTDQRAYLRPETKDRLSQAALTIMDVL